MKGKLFSCLVLMFLSISMVAQKVPVSGTVSDQTGPVIGASVIEKGTTNGTMTDNDGHFTLTVSKGPRRSFCLNERVRPEGLHHFVS